ncbi:hypothetical protein fh0823_23930 [Francisella halioticida]|uniref:hypothetical protein n=1 Tax=Francisella halioticida TaxID=549298 RepID=UPI001AF5C491|nr:hypothetical protein [Francisella halioticida]BCD92254.1 hypothetical protein fh0823_23930 [Francisella halioticida]
MYSLEKIKEVADSITKDDTSVNDSHTGAEYRGMIDGFELLLEKLKALSVDQPKIELVITEHDLEEFKGIVYHNDNMHWSADLDNVGAVDVEFISQDEYLQREA